ncbi:hypothetical protein KAI87_13780, partial [Myxococcota bacterium]|nr:hypothetical protein [Myxococcota bacterium]
GSTRQVSIDYETTFRNSGKVEFVFEPSFPPSGFGHALGVFTGRVTALNVVDQKTSEPSEAVYTDVEVGPSLILWSLEPENSNCPDPRVKGTLSGKTLKLSAEAIGLTTATSYLPLTFQVSWVDFEGTAQVLEQSLTSGHSVEMFIDPGFLPEGRADGSLSFNISAIDGHGTALRRTMNINFSEEYTVAYDGNVRIAELYQPETASSCIPGGEFGRSVSYSLSQSESRSRSVSYSVSVSLKLWVVSLGFGMSVSESVSVSSGESISVSGNILPGEYGVLYQQTQRLIRTGQILQRDACGGSFVVGLAEVTDWTWAPDLAITHNGMCPPAPPSNLPPAQLLE